MIYAIGDVHAQHTLLRAILDQIISIPLDKDDTIVLLGDYIDRGNEASQVIETLLELRDTYPRTIFLRGNHEQMILDAHQALPPNMHDEDGVLVSIEERLWLSQGGFQTLSAYRSDLDEIDDFTFLQWRTFLPESHWRFFYATQLEYSEGPYHFVHAGLLPVGCKSWEYQKKGWDPRLWIREPFLSSSSDFGGRVVIFGHTPQIDSKRPLIAANKLGLDTGAGCGGPLTAAGVDPMHPIKDHVYQIFQAYP